MDSFASQYKLLSEPLRALHDSEKIADVLSKHPSMEDRSIRRAMMVLISDILVGLTPRSVLAQQTQQIMQSDRFVKSLVDLIEAEIFAGHEEEMATLHEAYRKSNLSGALGEPVPTTDSLSSSPVPAVPAPTPTPHIPASRVMPQSTGEVAAPHDPKGTTALPNALLQNLKASLMHGGAPEEPLEGTGPKASYHSMLDQTPKPPAS
ncbi:MAG: hypothetical protein RLZZ234_61 [Candidatus Parcubacteria bacterium]|jgi:hypothetical protein